MSRKPSQRHLENKERYLRLRQRIVDLVEERGGMTGMQMAEALNESSVAVISCCVGLANHGWLRMAGKVKENYPNKKKRHHPVCVWERGLNPDPLPNLIKLCDYRRPIVIKSPEDSLLGKNQVRHNPITEEDLAWMAKYRQRRQDRYARMGLPVPAN